MATLQELEASLKADGVDLETLVPTPKPVEVATEVPKEPGVMDQIIAPVKAAVNDPVGATMAAVRGVEKSFLPDSRLLSHIEGTLMFPIIRGAELAARAFVEDDVEPELTSYRQLVEDSVLLDETLKARGQGIMEGTEAGIAAASGIQLLKAGGKLVGSIAPKAMQAVKEYRAGMATKKATKLGKKLLQLDKGPVLDAIVDRPEEVMKLIQSDGAYVDDLAQEMGTKLSDIQENLGKNVGKYRKNFVTDPTKKVNVLEPVQLPNGDVLDSPLTLMQSFEESITSTQGVNVLDSKQQKRLETLKSLISPQNDADGVPGSLIAPKDAMLALDKIDEMISIKEIQNGNISGAAVANLIQVRKALKSQIRGNDKAWAQADEIFSNYTEEASNLADRFSKDTRESFVSNLFGQNKNPIRERIKRTLDYADYVDTGVTGSGDAFFRRLANIKGANSIQEVNIGLTDKSADNVNRIVQHWVKLGENTGTTLFGAIGGGGGALISGGGGAAAGTLISQPVGKLVGGAAGLRMGLKMANPQRVLNSAIKAKNLSADAKRLAGDLQYVHKTFGNDGVISLMDIVGPLPATNELIKFISSQPKEKKEQQKPRNEVRFEKLGLDNLGK